MRAWIVLLAVGCGRLSSIDVDVTADAKFPEQLDELWLSVNGTRLASRTAPFALPVRFTVPLSAAEVQKPLDQQGNCAAITAVASLHGVAISDGALAQGDACAFTASPGTIALHAAQEDTLRQCATDADCGTGRCFQSPQLSSSLYFCTRACTSDADCPPQTGCSGRLGTGLCMPRCQVGVGCAAPGLITGVGWTCANDGLCFFNTQ